MPNNLLSFGQGTQRKPVTIAALPYAAGTQPYEKMTRTGYLARIGMRFTGNVDITTAGTAGTPNLIAVLQNHVLSANFGYQYRNVSANGLRLLPNLWARGDTDQLIGHPLYQNYNPAATGNQPVSFYFEDFIALNSGADFDKFLISVQTLNADTIVQPTFGSFAAVAANTEVGVITGVLTVTAEYFTVPDLNTFALPDTSLSQQILSDFPSNNALASGADNLLTLTPIQGPEYLGIGIYLFNNGVPLPATPTNISKIVLRVNGTDPIMQWDFNQLYADSFRHFGRLLPAGWLYLNFADDVGEVNAMSDIGRLVLSTKDYSQIDLIVTLTSAVVVAGKSGFELLKRMQAQAQVL